MKNYYQVLGVSEDADEVVIRAAYRALAQKYHPDKLNSDNQESNTRLMADINKAFSILGDVIQRKRYDLELINDRNKVSPSQSPPNFKTGSDKKTQEFSNENNEIKSSSSNLVTNVVVILMWVIGFYFIFK